MRQVFRSLPWVLPRDPAPIAEIFRLFGREIRFDKNQITHHGGGTGNVYFLTEGAVSFSFVDIHSKSHIFALVFPGCAFGDLDSLQIHAPDVIAECLMPGKALILSIDEYQQHLRQSVAVMESFAHMCVKKEEAILEGAFSNFTLNLDTRIRLLLYSILRSRESLADTEGFYQRLMTDPNAFHTLPWSPTVTEISQILSANRSTISTVVTDWAENDLLRREGRTMTCRAALFDPLKEFKSSSL